MARPKQVFQLRPFRPRFETLLYAGTFILPVILLTVFLPLPWAALGVWASIPPSALLAMWHNRAKVSLTMGADGVSILRFGRERFVRWADFQRFESTPRGIVAHTSEGSVPLGRALVVPGEPRAYVHQNKDRQLSQIDTLNELEMAATHWRQERAKPRIVQLLEGHAESEWAAAVERAVQGDYRASGITQSNLLEDLLNPDTPPALRELLAKSLRVRVEETEVEEAIEVFASERSKKTLRGLLEG